MPKIYEIWNNIMSLIDHLEEEGEELYVVIYNSYSNKMERGKENFRYNSIWIEDVDIKIPYGFVYVNGKMYSCRKRRGRYIKGYYAYKTVEDMFRKMNKQEFNVIVNECKEKEEEIIKEVKEEIKRIRKEEARRSAQIKKKPTTKQKNKEKIKQKNKEKKSATKHKKKQTTKQKKKTNH